MTTPLAPSNSVELAEAVRSHARVLALGAGTKPRLSKAGSDVTLLSTRALRGIIEYEPDEFTFTAQAGTPVSEIAAALAERGQYLPFDPMWLEAGATLGGTVAAGVSGPGRFRFGGVRDFILGIRFVDGQGRLLRMGGKVVKNAAGFNLPKFFVGSLGRFGILAEATFKVFPSPASRLTLKLTTSGIEAAAQVLIEAAKSRWEPEALDLLPDGLTVCLRLAGPASALAAVASEILGRWPGQTLSNAEAEALWSEVREFRWVHSDGVLGRVALTPGVLPSLMVATRSVDGVRVHVSAGGNVAFISLPAGAQTTTFQASLRGLGLSGVALRGEGALWWGARPCREIDGAVKRALDPQHRFPSLDED